MPAVPGAGRLRPAGWLAVAVAGPGLACAAALQPAATDAAARQDWPPFVLVAGLLAVGLSARDDGLFDAGGAVMANVARGGRTLFALAAGLVAVVTAVLNLDTAVAFLTPVLVVAARRRRTGEEPFVYLAVFLANGASLLLPGSNLTNLIVLGGLHTSGAAFAARMALPWVVAVVGVAGVVAVRWHRSLAGSAPAVREAVRARVGPGLGAVLVVVVAMVALRPPWAAVVVAVTGATAVGWTATGRRRTLADAERAVNLPVLAGLFLVAVDLGVLGRAWSWPHHLVGHTSALGSALAGAVTSVLVNNLPAASLLSARPPAHPYALLLGLDLGPNLAVTGALSAVLWLQVAHQAGASPSAVRYSRLGVIVTAVSLSAALAVFVAAN